MAFGTGVTQGGGTQAARASSSGFNYGPMLAGGQMGFARQMQQYHQRQAAQPTRDFQGNVIPWMQQDAQRAAAGWGQQLRQLQAQRPRPQAPARPAGQAPTAPTGTPAQQPAAQAAPAAPAAPQPQPPANPLLDALRGSPAAQGQTRTTASALGRAIEEFGGAPADQNQLMQRLMALFGAGGN